MEGIHIRDISGYRAMDSIFGIHLDELLLLLGIWGDS